MDVVIAGGHGKIALLLSELLSRRGVHVRGLIRNPDHAGEVRAAGAEPVVCDLEEISAEELAGVIGRPEAVVFAAGAGPGSGPERKWTMDYGGAEKLIAAAVSQEVDRFVMVSAMGADQAPSEDDGGFGTYLRAKAAADQKLVASGLRYVIVRPGRLTDDPPTEHVALAEQTGRGEIPRADVAAVLAAVLHEPRFDGRTFEVVGGSTRLAEAVAAFAR